MMNLYRVPVRQLILPAVAVAVCLALAVPAGAQHAMTKTQGTPSRVKSLDDPHFVGKWDFNRNGDLEGWKPWETLSKFKVNKGVLIIDAKTQRPWLELRGPYTAGSISQVEIRLRAIPGEQPDAGEKSAGANQGNISSRVRIPPQIHRGSRILWTTDAKAKYDMEHAIEFELEKNSKFTVVKLDVTQHPKWNGLIHKFCLDVGDHPDRYEVDYIYFHRLEKHTETKSDKSEAKQGMLKGGGKKGE